MIDPAVHDWLAREDLPADQLALVLHFHPPSEELLAKATTRAERIRVMHDHVRQRLGALTRTTKLDPSAVRILAATGQAIVQAGRDTLHALAAPESALARAADVTVLPNVLMESHG
ncbi:MAG: hypothetical protein K1X78_23320 [Verrucomicrobiaceae bacterium]|nr:hypothetical protein [Verrucomicrobiaceae bacterium]